MPHFLDIYSNEQIQLIDSKDLGHKLYTFAPMSLNSINLKVDNELFALLINANRSLGEVRGKLEGIEDNRFIVDLFRINESVFLCRIDNIDVFIWLCSFQIKTKPHLV